LLAVEEEAQKRAKEVLDALAGNRLDNVALELLGTKIRKTLWKDFGEPGAKHDNELQEKMLARSSIERRARFLASLRGGNANKGVNTYSNVWIIC
jgi:hypothetical protein